MHLLKAAGLALAALLTMAAGPNLRGDWNGTLNVTPTGSHVLGNPDAEVKVTEYVSYTCPHCAHFEIQADGPLRLGYVATGRVSVEVRHLVRDPVDLAAALLSNCGAPGRFFGNHTAFLRSQDSWIKAMNSASPVQRHRWSTGDMPSRMRAIAADFGFYAIAARRGYDRVAANRCLADQAMTQRLGQMRQGAMDSGVQGTPSFMINGVLLENVHDWPGLEAELRRRLS